MAIRADYHLHSSFSGDSRASMEEMIQKGIFLGLDRMCFTEHQDIDYVYETPEAEGLFEVSMDSYLCELVRCREKYADRIKILFGIELGVQPHLEKELAAFAGKYDFDFIIASAHICNRKDPYYPSFYEGRSDEEAYREYFSCILENLKVFRDFDVFGHLDYVVRYGKTKDQDYCYDRYKDILDRILTAIIDLGKGIEVNTGAIGYGLRDLNPCTDILRRYRELGGEIITLGSDAHAPENLAGGFERAASILTDAGFRYYTVFEKRSPEFRRISS